MNCNVLISSAGRRGHLVSLFRDALAARKAGGRVIAVDCGGWSAAARLSDAWHQVPRCLEPDFADTILAICRKESIRLIIPTIDTELPVYASNLKKFQDAGIHINISLPEVVALSGDKVRTNEFLVRNNIPCIPQWSLQEFESSAPADCFPVIIKPRGGSASMGVFEAQNMEELHVFGKRVKLPVVEQKAKGREYTVNCFVSSQGKLQAAVPHVRIEVRGGEVSKAVTCKEGALIELAEKMVGALPGLRGAFCFQCFYDKEEGSIAVIEINARFGGGYPLAHRAGVDFPGWLIDETLGQSPSFPAAINAWREGIAMTRWDDAVFFDAKELHS